MTKVIVEESKKKQEVYNGQIRADSDGRIVMVITDKRAKPFGAESITIRALVLRETERGFSVPFTTVPKIYASDAELAYLYPKVLSATITITEEE